MLTYFVIVGTSECRQPDRRPGWPRALPGGDGQLALAVFAYVAGRGVCQYLELTAYSPARTKWWCSAPPCAALAGVFVVQRLPAQVFIGDVGALALGATLGTVAVIVRQEIVLFIMGGCS